MLRRIVIGVVGVSVVLVGVIMLITPGPAIVVIPAGLAILSLEFAFARRILKRFKERFDEMRGSRDRDHGDGPSIEDR